MKTIPPFGQVQTQASLSWTGTSVLTG